MRIDGEGGALKDVAHDDAGRFVADAWQAFELFERVRDFALEFFDKRLRQLVDVHALGVEKSAGFDDFGNAVNAELDHFGWRIGFLEKDGGHLVYADVCALCAQDNRDKHRKWACVVQWNGRIREQFVQLFANEFDFCNSVHFPLLQVSLDPSPYRVRMTQGRCACRTASV